MPRIMSTAAASPGSSTLITWKRRASAASRSKYFLYSAQVVAAMVRNSPRARAGFRRFAASPWPAWPPAPIMVWASSMKRMIGRGAAFTSEITAFRRFSNSPLTPAPACSRPRSRTSSDTPCKGRGTSPAATRRANPSTTAVLPTPASPVRIGLFWRRRVRMSAIWRISSSRPRTGSMKPSRAFCVRSMVNWPNACPPAAGAAATPAAAAAAAGASSEASAVPLVMRSRSRRNVSGGILANWAEASRASGARESSASRAHRRWPERTRGAANSMEAMSHASFTSWATWGERAGARAFPVLKPSITRERSALRRAASMSYWRNTAGRSLSVMSRTLSNQCSISTVKWLRDRVSPVAASRDRRHWSFSLPTSDLRSTIAMVLGSPVSAPLSPRRLGVHGPSVRATRNPASLFL